MAGVNAAVVQKLAGHASIGTTVKYYTGLETDALREAQKRLPFGKIIEDVSYSDRKQKRGKEEEVARVVSSSHAAS